MSRPRSKLQARRPCLIALLLPLAAACAGEKEPAVDPAVQEAITQLQVTEAGSALAAALVEARQTDRLVFLHTGADW